MTPLRLALLVVAVPLAVSACADFITDISEFARVEVGAELPSGEPVPEAELTLYTGAWIMDEGRTDGNGGHVFRFVTPGTYGVVLRPPLGYRDPAGEPRVYRDGLRMEEGKIERVGFVLERCMGSMVVRVEDGAGERVPDAGLVLYTDRGAQEHARSGSDGTFTFERVGCGLPYGVSVDPPAGYTVEEGAGTSYVDGLVIEEDGARLVVDFRLSAG